MSSEIASSKIHQRLSELIEALLKDEEIGSGRELGRRTDLTSAALGNWLNLKSDPRLLKLMQFAYSIGWSMTELMYFAEGDEDPKVALARKKKVGVISESLLTAPASTSSHLSPPKNGSRAKASLSSSEREEPTAVDLLPERRSRERLRILLLDSMAVVGIPESEIFSNTAISGNLLRAILEINQKFKFGRSPFIQLAPFLFKVEAWEGLRPVFHQPRVSYLGCIDELIEDLSCNDATATQLQLNLRQDKPA